MIRVQSRRRRAFAQVLRVARFAAGCAAVVTVATWLVGFAATPLAAPLAAGPLAAQTQEADAQQRSQAHERIDFLVGQWHTTSTFPDGRTGEGELEYRWVFDGAWMKVEFHGDHPDGTLWEAHVMQRWDPEAGAYRSWVFRPDGPPLEYRGSVPEDGLFRIEYSPEPGITTGIDYHRQEDGTVYQENWIVEGGERRVTLRTEYRPRGGG